MNIDRPALRYTGAKFRLADWVISHFPPHKVYVEPFCGGASILLSKNPCFLEVINDLDQTVVNFFQVLRDRPNELIRAIELTPYSRLEKTLAYEASDDPLESARRLYVRSWQGYGGSSLRTNTGWRYLWRDNRKANVVGDWNNTSHLWAVVERLKGVQIECDEAVRVVERYGRNPNALLYVDPPYIHCTRLKGNTTYDHEMTDEQHVELAQALHGIEAMVLISGYDCALYRELYAGWAMSTKQTQTNGNGTATECLWSSPSATDAALPLFAAFRGKCSDE